jgi:hypothetical protein
MDPLRTGVEVPASPHNTQTPAALLLQAAGGLATHCDFSRQPTAKKQLHMLLLLLLTLLLTSLLYAQHIYR